MRNDGPLKRIEPGKPEAAGFDTSRCGIPVMQPTDQIATASVPGNGPAATGTHFTPSAGRTVARVERKEPAGPQPPSRAERTDYGWVERTPRPRDVPTRKPAQAKSAFHSIAGRERRRPRGGRRTSVSVVRDGTAVSLRGDRRHPYTRGALCAKVHRYLDYTRSPDRLLYPLRRAGGKGEGRFTRISWDDALDRIARLMKDDRDANFIERNEQGQTVNRWLSTGFLAASASSNESGYITHKVVRALGMLGFDNQARV